MTFAWAALSGCAPVDEPTTAGPNIIVYMVDTLRAHELGVYGAKITKTPSIDAFAADSVLFESARTPAPYTRAAVASFLTGLSPAVHGIETARHMLSDEHADLTLLTEMLQKQGYYTAALIANPNIDTTFGFDRGFDQYKTLYPKRAMGSRVTSAEMISIASFVVEEVKQFIDDAPANRPYFLFVLSIDPHQPYLPPEPYRTMYDRNAALGKAGQHDYIAAVDRTLAQGFTVSPEPMLALYRGEVTYADTEFGELLDWLRERRTIDETLIALTSDHGEAFIEHGERGHTKGIYDESVHIPLIVRYPTVFPAGTRRRENTDLMDLSATLADIAGADIPEYWRGRNLAQPIIDVPSFTMSHPAPIIQFTGIIDKNHKLIWNEISKSIEIYDIANDPLEQAPLDVVEHAATIDSLLQSLKEFRRASASLRANLIDEKHKLGPREVPKVPDAIRKQLESLGYLE